jgi:ATP-binding cassette subfamily F protein 3
VNLEIERGDKVAFIGKNGMGKTTMAKIIAKELDYNSGNLEIGHNVNIAFFAQHHAEHLPKELTIYNTWKIRLRMICVHRCAIFRCFYV